MSSDSSPAPNLSGRMKHWLPRYRPALLDCLKTYNAETFRADLVAGLIVGIVALPLSIALAIAVGAPPEAGLFTAIVGGGAIALLGGSRTQVSGPTAAFIVILAPILAQYGLVGLQAAGLMAGVILLLMGITGLGSLIKYVPYPVTTGFTTGIAVTIGVIQIKDLFGLDTTRWQESVQRTALVVGGQAGEFVVTTTGWVPGLPEHFHEKVAALGRGFVHTPAEHMLHTTVVGGLALAILIFYPRFWPGAAKRVPGPLVAVLASVFAALALDQFLGWSDVQTIGKRFSEGIPRGLPPFNTALFTDFSWSLDSLRALILPATAIAMLGAIESLLSAVVADGMVGTKHDSNSELIAQGIGNMLLPLFGGIAATGAIARTATNIRNGAKTPLASFFHALTLLAIVLAAAPYASFIPMATLAAILLVVAWNMAELKHFRHLLRAPISDTLVLLTCFGLTVFLDMVYAVLVGMVLAALLFMRRMADVTSIDVLSTSDADQELQSHDLSVTDIPQGVLIYSVDGPFFFGASEKAISAIESIGSTTRVVILRLRRVPAMDATGLYALEKIFEHLKRRRVQLILSGVREQPRQVMKKAGFLEEIGVENVAGDIEWALVRCYELLGPDATKKRTGKTQTLHVAKET